MKEFTFDFFNGHILINFSAQTALIDTGAPLSFGRNEEIKICESEFLIKKSYFGITIDEISEYLGKNIDLLVGLDILKNYDLFLDFRNSRLTFFKDKETLSFFEKGNLIEANFSNSLLSFLNDGFPVIDVDISGEPARAFIDTGAFQSYIDKEYVEGKKPLGEIEDFHPLVKGFFRAEIFEVEAEISGYKKRIRVGKLPDSLSKILSFSGISMIIGNDFLKDFDVLISFLNKKVTFSATG